MAEAPAVDPWYQAVAVDKRLEASLPGPEWLQVVDVVQQNSASSAEARNQAGFFKRHFKKSSLPQLPPTLWFTDIVPMLRVLADDVKPGAPIEIKADLRGPLKEKIVWQGEVPTPGGRVRKIEQTTFLDVWLVVGARLDDGTRVGVTITDRLRHRKVHKRSQSGKHKTKQKEKTVRRVDIEVAGDEHDFVPPEPPSSVPVSEKVGASRPTAAAKLTIPLETIDQRHSVLITLKALAEVHRYLKPRVNA